jgi:hypothetical protein
MAKCEDEYGLFWEGRSVPGVMNLMPRRQCRAGDELSLCPCFA